MILEPRRALAVAAVLAAGLTGPGPQAAAAPAGPASPAAGAQRTITLVTGDHVVLDESGAAHVRPAPGREKVGFLTQKDVDGDVHVTPFDALADVRAGRLDPRLFDVTRLLAGGYGDDARPDIPLIVTHPAGPRARAMAAAQVVRELPSVQATAVKTAKSPAFWAGRDPSAGKIWLDGPVHAALDRSVPQIGAPEAWKAGYTGKGTTVAILDTGIDATHPDLADAVAQARDFTASASGTTDRYGHGTHVASIVTGNNVKYMGVAPDTKLMIGKVLDDTGSGEESEILAGMEWAATGGAQVINMSLGDYTPSDGTDLLSQALDALTERTGALFVVAAGNNGKTPGSPAAARDALTVGAVDHDDHLADFSSRGPRKGDNGIKPEITAPGVDITAAMAKDSALARTLPHADDTHLIMSGTSMATPHVTGAAAILAGEHPDWKAPQLKAALVESAKPDPARTVFEQGGGRVDVAKAAAGTLVATPATLNDGVQRWPHADDQPVRNVVTYHNYGTTPVTVNVTADLDDPAGKPAPAGMFTLSAPTLTVAPGADAPITLTADTTVDGPDGNYTGVLTAGTVRVPVSLTREPESYDVRFGFLGTDGKPTADYAYRLVDTRQAVQYVPYDASGSVGFRVPKGHYYFESQVATGTGIAVTIEPDLDVSKPVDLTVDPRTAKPAGLVLDNPKLTAFEKSVDFARTTAWGGQDALATEIQPGAFGDVLVNRSATTAPGQFRYSVGGRFAVPDAQGRFDASPSLYSVRADTDGRLPADPVLRVRDRDLVHVHSVHAAAEPGTVGTRESVITKPLPYTLEEYYSPETPWMNFFQVTKADGTYVNQLFSSAPKVYPRVREAADSYGRAVFGPDFPANPARPTRYASRQGDSIVFQIPQLSDATRDMEGFGVHTGTAVLYRNGVQVGVGQDSSGGLFSVPPGPGTFRLHTEMTRPSPLSSKVVADYTFVSGTVTGTTPQRLPLMAIKFAPALNANNAASAFLPTLVPIGFSHNAGGTVKPTAIQVSHDHGGSWTPAPLAELGGRWYTVLAHPWGAKSVSLRGTAVDGAGNSVTETIVDAFVLR
ncbi:S8 family peptidase [Amycolatopsis sp. NPDC088138]|uniref:S8 family peptidase n=1 Tax=Amycolatopsis sp. NPDC088138 TaxID=3363938 RepID=UPI0037FA4BDA